MTERALFPKSRAKALIREETELIGPFHWEPLYGDGSTREFYRVSSQNGTVVLVWSPLDIDSFPNENDSYVYLGRHLSQKQIPVPGIYGYWRSDGLILIEDLGSVHLQDAVRSNVRDLDTLYSQATELLLRMQVRAAQDLNTAYCFDAPVYDPQFILKRELEYFYNSFLLGALGLEISWGNVEPEFSVLASRAGSGEGPLLFMHRDFQSRNLMLKDGLLYLIDFQGARLGPPQYDLAALLLDPYVELPESLGKKLLFQHSARLNELIGISSRNFLEKYKHVALCRNLQVLAAFAHLSRVRGRLHFAQYIVPAWKRLRHLLAGFCRSEYQTLANLVHSQNEEDIASVAAKLATGAQSAFEGELREKRE
ncbi:MAG: phosphotransferase, partial [Deltaproteobacteria bacterium]